MQNTSDQHIVGGSTGDNNTQREREREKKRKRKREKERKKEKENKQTRAEQVKIFVTILAIICHVTKKSNDAFVTSSPSQTDLQGRFPYPLLGSINPGPSY